MTTLTLDHTRNSCSYEEETISLSQQMELIENKYNAGSVVFAKVVGYPWWPAMVQDDPKYMTYFILEDLSDIPVGSISSNNFNFS